MVKNVVPWKVSLEIHWVVCVYSCWQTSQSNKTKGWNLTSSADVTILVMVWLLTSVFNQKYLLISGQALRLSDAKICFFCYDFLFHIILNWIFLDIRLLVRQSKTYGDASEKLWGAFFKFFWCFIVQMINYKNVCCYRLGLHKRCHIRNRMSLPIKQIYHLTKSA